MYEKSNNERLRNNLPGQAEEIYALVGICGLIAFGQTVSKPLRKELEVNY